MNEVQSNPTAAAVAEAVLGHGLFPVCVVEGGVIAHASPLFAELFRSVDTLVGNSVRSLASPTEREKLSNAVATAVNNGARVNLQFQALRADGAEFEAEANVVRTGSPQGQTVVMSLADVSGRWHSLTELRLLAFSDPLTGLANRALFLDRLRNTLVQARRRGESFGVMLADLDGFKQVNDAMGHAAGDTVLRTVATRMAEALRDGDTLARVGGDEFAMVLPRLSHRNDATRVAGRLVRSLAEPLRVDGKKVRVGVSVGLATWPDNGRDVDTLYLQADKAMYAAKRAGKNQYYFAADGAQSAISAYLPFFQWSNVYNVGVDVIDEDHKRLAELINGLGRLLKAGQPRNKLVAQLEQITSFAQTHFAAEEALMHRHGYLGAERHKRAHRRLNEALPNLFEDLGKQSMVLTMHYLQEWLLRHIEAEDRAFAAALNRTCAT